MVVNFPWESPLTITELAADKAHRANTNHKWDYTQAALWGFLLEIIALRWLDTGQRIMIKITFRARRASLSENFSQDFP